VNQLVRGRYLRNPVPGRQRVKYDVGQRPVAVPADLA
jgi:hypothetical protein